MEDKNKVIIQRIVKAQESKVLILFFSMFVIVISFLVFNKTNLVVPGFLTLVILFYILSAPQSRLGYYIVGNSIVFTSLQGKKEIDISTIEDIRIINIPFISFPFLTNGVGYHVGKPKLKEWGQVMMLASTFPGEALLLTAGKEAFVITPAQPSVVKDILQEKKISNISGQEQIQPAACKEQQAEA
ncbi:PH domain-containing protein [Candidatus Contubernalis alkaliaceticus]|uniref:PH domain-containing protein n=1 Tax=Candidatus Contubernalis alkaliaceticus TaxID=338645 RepID=UPI001F4BF623|nr:PH domain-containing protein [Candidatus Contubernalis alkalaceticus]UNC90654.1 hypothetical protein HUE98_00260 [Candidatus Contubernalis alkalaceticus]